MISCLSFRPIALIGSVEDATAVPVVIRNLRRLALFITAILHARLFILRPMLTQAQSFLMICETAGVFVSYHVIQASVNNGQITAN